MMIGDISHPCCGVSRVTISTEEGGLAKISVLVVCERPLGFDLLLGIEAIKALGGTAVGASGQIQISDGQVAKYAAITINEPNFTATFDYQSQACTAAWSWSEDRAPEGQHNGVSEYPVVVEIREEYKRELRMWISNGWLMLYPEEKLEPPKGLIPLTTAK